MKNITYWSLCYSNANKGTRSTRSRPTQRQIIELVNFMENNLQLVLNQLEYVEANRLWRFVSDRLNNVEIDKKERDIESWRRVITYFIYIIEM